MIQFDLNLEYAILTMAYADTLTRAKEDLAERKRKLKWLYEKDNLTAEHLKRANTEESHIRLMVEYIQITEDVFKVFQKALTGQQETQIDWHQEYIRECEKNLAFTELMLQKYSKLKKNEQEKRD